MGLPGTSPNGSLPKPTQPYAPPAAPAAKPYPFDPFGMQPGAQPNRPTPSAGWSTGSGATPPPMSATGAHYGRQPGAAAPTDPNNNLLAPSDQEKFYGATSGEYTDPSYTEKLVAQGMGGQLNDYYEFGQNKLNDQYAAMGGGPSGALLRASQGMRADQAHDMMDYTRSADQLHYGRLGAGESAAGAADAGRTGRLGLAFGDSMGLANGESADALGFYGNASNTSNPFTQSAINNGVQQSTINPAGNFIKDSLTTAGTFYKGSQGGGAGGR